MPLNEGPEMGALQEAAKVAGASSVKLTPDDADVNQLARTAKFSSAATAETSDRWQKSGYWLVLILALLMHPEWHEKEPFASVIKGDIKGALAGGEKALTELLMATHAGMTSDEYTRTVADWLATARHPKFNRPYTELVYQPMLELLAYLRANGFKTFIVSGGGAEFIRVFAERTYGVPPEQVIGSTIKTKFELLDGKPVIVRLRAIDFVDDGPGKPVGIAKFIGRRPIMAFGNSDGDCRCSNTLLAVPAPVSASLSIIPTGNANMPMIANPRLENLSKRWTQRRPIVGSS
jgi:hypothetical protein